MPPVPPSPGHTSPAYVLQQFERAYHAAGIELKTDIQQRIRFHTHQISASYEVLAREVTTLPAVRNGYCVGIAFAQGAPRATSLIRAALPGFDWTGIGQTVLNIVRDVAEEVALFVGGGAVLGGVAGAAAGSLAGGIGAIPGAIAGAQAGAALGSKAMLLIGLVSLAQELLKGIVDLAQHFARGFALSWNAANFKDTDTGRYVADMARAADAFAHGQVALLVAVLSGVTTALMRSQAIRSALYKELAGSKLGPRFAQWVAANEAALHKSPVLQPGASAAERPPVRSKPAAPAPDSDPAAAPAPAGKTSEGRGKSCKQCVTVGHPVNPIFGNKLLTGELERDFALPAPLPLLWQRSYSSDNPRTGWLGQGWSLPISLALQVSADHVVVLDPQQREVSFSLPQIGQRLYSPYEQVTLVRLSALCFALIDRDQTHSTFALADPHAGMAHLTDITDRNGNTTRILYDECRQPTRLFDSAGRTYVLDFSGPRLRTVSLLRDTPEAPVPPSAVPLVHYDYDAAGDLIRVRNRLGQTVREFGYRNHLLIRHSQPGGLIAEYTYDDYRPAGRVLRHWTNSGQSWSFDYRPHETVVTDRLGRRHTYRFDRAQRYTGATDALGQRTEQLLDDYGNVLAATDAAGRTTRYRYDSRSLLIRIEAPEGGITRIVYDGRTSQPALVTDAEGGITAYRYDACGNLASVTDALGQRTHYRHDGRGLPLAIIDAHGKTRTFAYDSSGQVRSHTDCAQHTTRFDYDDEGRLIALRDALGHVTRYRHDQLGRLTAIVAPDGREEQLDYDALGRLIAHVDGAGQRTVYARDVDGKPLTRTDALGQVLQYRYDAARRLVQLVNENGAVHAFAYDAADRLVQEIRVDARVTRYRYDASGLPVAREELGTLPNLAPLATAQSAAIETTYRRDGGGRLIEKIVSHLTGAAQAEQLRSVYAYDKLGRLVQARNQHAHVQLQYDAIGQLVAETTTAEGRATTLTHAYDALGNRLQTTLPDGRVMQQLYYGSGHLHQISLDGEVVTDLERDALHRVIGRTQGAMASRFQYDPAGRLTAQQASKGEDGLLSRHYGYDRAGNLATLEDRRSGLTRYQYDAIGRLLQATQPTLAEVFAFDPAHNLLDAQHATGSAGRIVNNRVTVHEDKRFAYDTHGNLIDKKIGRHMQMTLRWNAEHQLVEANVTRPAQEDQPAVQTVRYGYDPFGRRLFKRDAFGTTRFLWDGNRLLCETRGSHMRTHVYEPESFVPLAQVQNSAPQVGQATGSRRQAQRIRHLHVDHLGTPRELTADDGKLVWAATYRAWGNTLAVTLEPEPDASSTPGADTFAEVQPIRFQGQYCDSETGLHYNRFRYYDPDIGRFISQDPIGLQGGYNLYQYAPNPIAWIDPLGLTACSCKGISPSIVLADIERKSRSQIRANANAKGLTPHPTKSDKWLDPVTGKERLRIDSGHIDKTTGRPYDDPQAAAPHVHLYDASGTKIKDASGNPHIVIDPSLP
ncbi:DUF6861 domain-containing protein [Noviherbaspirillum saxi]|nr:RHS repeat-associated core domain-containing protein [Noviherbaspirillum saxi]